MTAEKCVVESSTTSVPTNITFPSECQPFERSLSRPNCTKATWNQQGITIAGNRTSMSLMYPFGIFLDHSDNLYVSDSADHKVEKFSQGSTDGTRVTEGIRDIFIDSHNILFILGTTNSPTRKLNLNSFQMETVLSHEGDPWSIFVNQNGDIYITEVFYNNNTGQLMKYSFNNGVSKKEILLTTKDSHPLGIFVDQCDTVYVALSSENGSIQKIVNVNSTPIVLASDLAYPVDVLLDKYGNLYFIQLGMNSIKRINIRDGKTEIIINEIEKVTTQYSDGRYSWPMNIAFDSKLNLYVSDQDNHCVKMFPFQGGDLFC